MLSMLLKKEVESDPRKVVNMTQRFQPVNPKDLQKEEPSLYMDFTVTDASMVDSPASQATGIITGFAGQTETNSMRQRRETKSR